MSVCLVMGTAFINVSKISRMLASSRTIPLIFTSKVFGSQVTSSGCSRIKSKTAPACGLYLLWMAFNRTCLLCPVAFVKVGGWSRRDRFFKTSSWLIKLIFSLLEIWGLCNNCSWRLLFKSFFDANCSSKWHCLNKESGIMIDSE